MTPERLEEIRELVAALGSQDPHALRLSVADDRHRDLVSWISRSLEA